MQNAEPIRNCLACDNEELDLLLYLNSQPLANSYKDSKEEHQEQFPLAVNVCKHCFHVQLTHKVNPDLMFKHYLYVSGTSKTQLEYFEWFARFCIETHAKKPLEVLDIGCNDGSQLNVFKRLGLDTFGVDPATNLHAISSKEHNVLCGYFDETFNNFVDIVTCQNAFAHNPDPLKLLLNCKRVLKKGGMIFATTSQANMIKNNEFDTIYHEHISFYNIKSMHELCKRAGLNLIDVVKNPIHGVSYIFVISNNCSKPSRVSNLIEMEKLDGLYDMTTYEQYKKRCMDVVLEFNAALVKASKDYRIIGYGASAKGNTLLNFAGNKFIECIVDDNEMKQGKFTPGTSIPIVSPDQIKTIGQKEKILFVPLAWNFYNEIRGRIKTIRNNPNDRFLKYFPEVKIEL